MTNSGTGPSPMVRIAGRYGLLGAIVLFITLTGLFYLGQHPLLIPFLFDLRIFLFALFLVFAIKGFRDKSNGELHFWQGLSIGIVCYVMIAFITSLLLWIWGGIIDPSFVSEYISLKTDELISNMEIWTEMVGKDTFNSQLNRLPNNTSLDLAFDYFLKSMPIGFILTLIISILLRKTT